MADEAGDDELVVRPARQPSELVEDDELIVPGRRRRTPPGLIVASVGVLAGAVVGVAITNHAGHKATLPPPAASATVTATRPGSPADRTALQLGPAVDLALAEDGTLFVLGPNRLTRIVPDGSRPEFTTTVLPPEAAFVAVDAAAERVWVVGQDTNEIDGYDPGSLTRISRTQLRRNVQIQAIATLDEQLFLATTAGIFQLGPPDSVPRLLPGFSAAVQAITADPARDQMLAVADDHSLLRIRAGRVHVTPPPSGEVLPDSLEVTGPGIWAVGFGIAGGGGSRIARVNPSTLALVPVGPGDPNAPQGTDGWQGAAVFWVRHVYSATVICYDARTGTPTTSYPDLAAAGDPDSHAKIVSTSGAAYAISGQDVFRLKTTQACPG
jgi:hypothetical protein